ncbi:hypothetical protein EU527_10700 [Candidatus Thorarchaeota archaeon]|nr:MAG: hypothetical protein EU527_10700 [Candidatus Thorarchaeota archaeon]
MTILAILMILGGLFNLLGAPASYTMLDLIWSVIAGLLGLALGLAMWQLIPWARKAALLWYIISLVMTFVISFVVVLPVIELLVGPAMALSVMMIALIPSTIISLIIILYLNSGGVKAAFEGVGGW